MSPRLGDRDLTPEQFDHTLAVLTEQGFASGEWAVFARAMQLGMSDADSRVQTFCRLADVIMRMRFARRASDEAVQSFLEKDLHLESDNARTVVLMTILAAKKAVEVSQEGKPREDAVSELEQEYTQNPELAEPMVETGLRFLARSNSKLKVALALAVLVCSTLPAALAGLSIGVVLHYSAGFFWWTSAIIAALSFVAIRLCGQRARTRLFGMTGPQTNE